MIELVRTYVKENKLLTSNDRIVVGVSGGADSVCLLLCLKALQDEYGLHLFVVHVNHGLRGQEARDDQWYVESLCERLKVPCHSVSVDVAMVAKENGYSLEEAGRNLRYEIFQKEYIEKNCNKIAIAHNKNDQAETVLLNLVRGSGMQGLTGIKAWRNNIIRPLLGVSRDQIEGYLKEQQVSYCVDATNLEDVYTRNKIRLHVLPTLEEVNDQAISHIVNAAKQLAEVEAYLKKITDKLFDRIVTEINGQYFVKVNDLLEVDLVLRKRIIREMLSCVANRLKDIEEKHVSAILSLLDKEVGKQIHLPYQMVATRTYEQLRLEIPKADEMERKPLLIPILSEGVYPLPKGDSALEVTFLDYKKNMIIPKNRCTKWFDYDKIKNTIFLRNRKQGDYLQINASGNVKTIKSLFIDEKIPREQREEVPLLCDGNHVMWVLGGRISEAYKVTEHSRKILVVKMMEV